MLDAEGAEVTRDEHHKVIVYAKSLALSDTKYHFHNEEIDQEIGVEIANQGRGVLLQGNRLVVLRVKGVDEVFATGDFNPDIAED